MSGKRVAIAFLAAVAVVILTQGAAFAATNSMSNWYVWNQTSAAWYQEPALTTPGTPGTMDVADYGTIGTTSMAELATPGAITYEGTGVLTLTGSNIIMGAKNGTTPTSPYQYAGGVGYNTYGTVVSGGVYLSSTGTVSISSYNTASSYVDPVFSGPVGSTVIIAPYNNSGELFDVGSGALGKPVTANGGITVEVAPNRQSLTDTSPVTLNNGSTLEFSSTFVGNPVLGAVVTGNASAFTLQAYSYGTNVQPAFQNLATAYSGNGQLALAAPGMTETWGGHSYYIYGTVIMPSAQYQVTGTTTINAYNALNISTAGTLTNANFNLTGQGNSLTPSMLVLNGTTNFTGTTTVSGTGVLHIDNGTYNTNGNDSQGGIFNTPTSAYTATFTGAGAQLTVGDNAVYAGTNLLKVSGNIAFAQDASLKNATLAFNVVGDAGGASPVAGTDFSQLVMNGGVGGALTGLANANLVVNVNNTLTQAQFAGNTYGFVTGSSSALDGTDAFAKVSVIMNGGKFNGPCGYGTVNYGSNGSLSVTIAPLLAGDIDGSGTVDSADYNIWAANAGDVNATWSQGDLDGSGTVDSADYNIWAAAAGTTVGAPEPISMIILAIGGGLVALKRRND